MNPSLNPSANPPPAIRILAFFKRHPGESWSEMEERIRFRLKLAGITEVIEILPDEFNTNNYEQKHQAKSEGNAQGRANEMEAEEINQAQCGRECNKEAIRQLTKPTLISSGNEFQNFPVEQSAGFASGGVESRNANTGNMPGSVPGEEISSSATRFVRMTEVGCSPQARAGVATGPLAKLSPQSPGTIIAGQFWRTARLV